jgi:hypothetical protein
MMMKMLEAGGLPPLIDNIRAADDDNPRGYYEFERVKRLKDGDTAWLADARGKAVKVIAALLPYLPTTYAYRVIFMRRAMPEVLASQRQMLIHRGEDPEKFSDEELAQLFEKHLRKVYAWLDAQLNVQRIDVDYNEMMRRPQPHIARLNEFLGNTLDVARMAQVVDSRLHRQRAQDT